MTQKLKVTYAVSNNQRRDADGRLYGVQVDWYPADHRTKRDREFIDVYNPDGAVLASYNSAYVISIKLDTPASERPQS